MKKRIEKVLIYDTTLRDGAAREGLSLSVEDKIRIAHKLDEFGLQMIEAGFPGSNPKEEELFRRLTTEKFHNAGIIAFGSTRAKKIDARRDPHLKKLINAKTETVCIFGKSWDFNVRAALKTSLAENLRMIEDTIAYLKKRKRRVIFDAEHFFDGFKENPKYALKTVQAAAEAGADWVVLCDTNGGALPFEVLGIVRDILPKVAAPLGIHAHNDSGCAVANSLSAVRAGAQMVQGTINGYGERCGNADLCSILPALKFKMGLDCIDESNLSRLTELSHFVSELANVSPDAFQPYVGASAFAHKGGAHASGVARQSRTYEHIDPSLVGNRQHIVVSEISGRTAILQKALQLGCNMGKVKKKVGEILKQVKDLEHAGYHFEAADGSFDILINKTIGDYKRFFELESFRVIVDKRETGKIVSEATIKIHTNGERIISTAEGNGPVNALDLALRGALARAYPDLENMVLTDYKVRVLDESKGTGAMVRVWIETSDRETSWGTVGVHENIIEASWNALAESIEFGLGRLKPKK